MSDVRCHTRTRRGREFLNCCVWLYFLFSFSGGEATQLDGNTTTIRFPPPPPPSGTTICHDPSNNSLNQNFFFVFVSFFFFLLLLFLSSSSVNCEKFTTDFLLHSFHFINTIFNLTYNINSFINYI